MSAGGKDFLLTTFPQHRSGNVGDHLITHSLLRLIRARVPNYNPLVLFREESLDIYPEDGVRSIIAPGFSVVDETYPKLFALYSDSSRLKNFFPIGCSFQHAIPAHSSFDDYTYGEGTLEFLKGQVARHGALLCRDELIVGMLRRNGIGALYSGDLAVYDESVLGRPFRPPESISSIAVTVQHHDRFDSQSLALIRRLKEHFGNAQLFISLHSKPNKRSIPILNYAVSLGFQPLLLSGDVDNLNVYDNIDIHVGYRLHGHLSFLRRRKPSVLLVEDARSFGFSRTPGTSFGCFDALCMDSFKGDESVPNRVIDFLDVEQERQFSGYGSVFTFIDHVYEETVCPALDRLAADLY